jgi:hypothetical protein
MSRNFSLPIDRVVCQGYYQTPVAFFLANFVPPWKQNKTRKFAGFFTVGASESSEILNIG